MELEAKQKKPKEKDIKKIALESIAKLVKKTHFMNSVNILLTVFCHIVAVLLWIDYC